MVKNLKAWNSTAFYLSKAVDPNGNLLFGDAGCNGRPLKAQFQELMTFMKRLEHCIPFDLGCDNQDPSAELQLGLEDLLEMHSAITNNTASVNASQAASRVMDKMNAETLQTALMAT
jgi:hypothetical protein